MEDYVKNFDNHLSRYVSSFRTASEKRHTNIERLPIALDSELKSFIETILNNERKYHFLISHVDQIVFKQNVVEEDKQGIIQEIMKDIMSRSAKAAHMSEESLTYLEEKLHTVFESEQKYRFLLDHIEDVIFTCNSHLKITFLNPHWSAQLKYLENDCLDTLLLDYIHQDDIPLFREKCQRLFESGQKIINMEYRIKDNTHQWNHHLLTGIPIEDNNGKVIEMLGVSHDITERKVLQKKLRDYNEQLERRVRERTEEINSAYEELRDINMKLIQAEKMAAVGELASGIGHEFNNLIGIMQAYAEFAHSQRTERNISKLIDAVLLSSKRAKTITQSLLSFSRRIEKKQELSNINEALEEVLLLLETEFRKADVRVIKKLKKLPDIVFDVGQIEQVFLNMLVNAKHAIIHQKPEKGIITVSTRELPNAIEITFEDNGIGIAQENIDKIFQPFFSTKGSYGNSNQPGGTGLGLSVSLGIIENHCGTIVVDSEQYKGTKFTITLPKVLDPEKLISNKKSDGIEKLAIEQPSVKRVYKKSASILIVDDEEYLRNALCDILSNEGYNLIPAENGEQAINLFNNTHFDLVLMDIMMPGFDGIETIRILRTLKPDIKVIVISGSSQSLSQLKLVQSREIQGVIYKPFDLEKLITLISSTLEEVPVLEV